MALTPFSLLLLSRKNPNFQSRILSLIQKTRPFYYFHGTVNRKAFSTSPLLQPETNSPKTLEPKTGLSSRMSFLFDQMDAIENEKENNAKDEALQMIRAWREKKRKTEESNSELGPVGTGDLNSEETVKKDNLFMKEVEVVHPWPEWIELMERLLHQNYFDHRRKVEDPMIQDFPDDVGVSGGLVEEGVDFTRDWITVRTAVLNFGRDRFDILRSLSRKDIQILVGHGCPSVDHKVVFSSKLLRKHVHLDEGDVCSSCSLRSTCNRAYLLTRKEDEARTLDIMRVLLTFGFEPVTGSVENKALLKMKSIKTVVRKLLHEVGKLSAVPIDPNLPPPVIKKQPPKVKQPPPPPKKRVGRDDIEMKKGDWLCPKCDFMNFAKNTICLQCDAKRPKRQLLPGEWECPECNFLNYRRNMACFHCDHKRPPDEFMDNHVHEKPRGPRTRLERVASVPDISNAWNFDFDDNESDGADVAAFEFADPPRMGEVPPLDGQDYRQNLRGHEDYMLDAEKRQRVPERDRYSHADQREPHSHVTGTGFDDFDEEEDDIDSYELDTSKNHLKAEVSSKNFSELEGSGSESFSDFDSNHNSCKPSWPMRGRAAFSASENDDIEEPDFDSDKELSVHPNWKSTHIADSGWRSRNRGGSGPYRGLSFGSDDDTDQDGRAKQNGGRRQGSNENHLERGNSDSDNGFLFGTESDDDDLHSYKNKMSRNKAAPDRRGNAFKGRHQSGSARDMQIRSNDMMSGSRKSFHDDGSGFCRNERGSRGDSYSRQRENDRGRDRGSRWDGRSEGRNETGGDRRSRGNARWNAADRRGNLRDFDRPARGEGFRNRQQGRYNQFDDRSDRLGASDAIRPRRRIIER